MSDQNKELVKRWFEEVWNKGRREAIAEMLSADAFIQDGNGGSTGPEGFYPFFDRMHAAFSDIRISLRDVFAEGDKVCVRWSSTVRHTGKALDIPPTNKQIEITGITVAQVSGQKIVAGWQNWDMLGMMQQLRCEPAERTYIAPKQSAVGGNG